jgi:hypothetical protein
MPTIIVDIKGLDKLNGDLRQFEAGLSDELQRITLSVGEALRAKVAVYPGPAHSPVIWASDKQRRFYFAMRNKGGLPMEYTRQSDAMSQRIGPSWAVERRAPHDATVGTRATYARWVQSAEQQTAQHKATGWITDDEAVKRLETSGQIETIAIRGIEALIRRTLGG